MTHAHDGHQATPGGFSLRVLRRSLGLTQLTIELDAGLGTGYLQRLESGRVRQPERSTLERILDALDARYSERREILEAFGYTVPAPPPDDREIEWAVTVSRRELEDFPFPAYVLDCTHRLLAWNATVPRLLGDVADDRVRRELAGRSMIEAWFDPDSPLSPLVASPERFLPALIRAFRYEMSRFQMEPWHGEVVDRLLMLDSFRTWWGIVEGEEAPASAARAVMPLTLQVPGSGQLSFRLSAEPFIRDARFRIVYYFPSDTRTMRVCDGWSGRPPEAPAVMSSPD